MAGTWVVAFDRLQQTEPGAVGLLRLLAFCAPEAIPLSLLLQHSARLAGQLGDDREAATALLIEALDALEVEGVQTNRSLLLDVLSHRDFAQAQITTRWLAQEAIAA